MTRIEQLTVPAGQLALWALGQSGFVLQGGATTAYIDPDLSNSVEAYGGVRRFPVPLDPATIEPRRFGFSQWNYRYSGDYGSKQWSLTTPNREGADTIPIKNATLLADGQTVFLEIPNLRPAMQCQLTYDLRTKTGEPLTGDLYHTIYKTAQPYSVGHAVRALK